MEEKENLSPTRQRTLAAIHTAFYELLRKMPFEKITIRNICDEAKVSKFTFYNYYCDKYELAEALEEEFIGGLCTAIEGPELSEAGNSLRSKNVWNYITDHAEEYRALTTLTLNGVNFNQYLLERLQKLTQKQIADGVRRSGKPCTHEAALFFSHMVAANQIAELEIIVGGLIGQETLAQYQREAAIQNAQLLEKIRNIRPLPPPPKNN